VAAPGENPWPSAGRTHGRLGGEPTAASGEILVALDNGDVAGSSDGVGVVVGDKIAEGAGPTWAITAQASQALLAARCPEGM
jgi:hypothetical protein